MASGTLFSPVWLQWSTDALDSDGEMSTGARTWHMSCLMQSYEDCKSEISLGPLWLSNEMLSRGGQSSNYDCAAAMMPLSLSWDWLCPATSGVDDKVMTRVNARSLRYASLFLVGAPRARGPLGSDFQILLTCRPFLGSLALRRPISTGQEHRWLVVTLAGQE